MAVEEAQFLEFDVFVVEDRHASIFVSYLEETIKGKFRILDMISQERLFQEVVHPDRAIHEIQLSK